MKSPSDIILSNTSLNISHREQLKNFIVNSKKTIEIVCPFISLNEARWLVSLKPEAVNVKVITELSKRGVLSGVQDVEAMECLRESGCDVRFFTTGLHAKLFWFDRGEIVITSSNLTVNGLEKNFEVGISLNPFTFTSSNVKGGSAAVKEHLLSLMTYVTSQSEVVSDNYINQFRIIADKGRSYREAIEREIEKIEGIEEIGYTPINRHIENKQNIDTEVLMTTMFNGFDKSLWTVFNHGIKGAPTEEQRRNFRLRLDREINPEIRKFFLALQKQPNLRTTLSGMNYGFSKNILLTTRLPFDRYLFVTKPREGKLASRHIGEASYIIGIGMHEGDQGWLEIRAGVEEETKTELTKTGRKLLERVLTELDIFHQHIQALGKGWELTHLGGVLRGEDLSKENIAAICRLYLNKNSPSDFQIRRKYYWNNSEDEVVLSSPKIATLVAKDVESLNYFFNLASS